MKNETKQTAVDWLMNQAVNWARNTNSGNDIVEFPKDAIKQAKAMERDKSIQFALDCQEMFKEQIIEKYNQTYGGNK